MNDPFATIEVTEKLSESEQIVRSEEETTFCEICDFKRRILQFVSFVIKYLTVKEN